MSKSVIRPLTLGIYATALVDLPMVAPSKAGTSSSVEIEKNKKIQNSPGVRDPSSSSPVWPPPITARGRRRPPLLVIGERESLFSRMNPDRLNLADVVEQHKATEEIIA